MGAYQEMIDLYATIEEQGIDPAIMEWCSHARRTPGCPGCANLWLRWHDIDTLLCNFSPEKLEAARNHDG